MATATDWRTELRVAFDVDGTNTVLEAPPGATLGDTFSWRIAIEVKPVLGLMGRALPMLAVGPTPPMTAQECMLYAACTVAEECQGIGSYSFTMLARGY